MQLVFDGHNDVLLRLWRNMKAGGDPVAEFAGGTAGGHIDAPRAKKGGLVGGLCAIYIPSGDLVLSDPDADGHYATPLAAPLDYAPSLDIALEMASIALRLDRAGAWRLCRSVSEIRKAVEDGVFAAVMHMEGCEAIDADLVNLDVFHAAGLRSLGPVWSRHNIFGHGVPFAFPMTTDTGPGLTDAGFRLVRECNRLGIAIDLSHITEKGFWDVANLSTAPLVATHSNVHALCPSPRNLTPEQLKAIRDSDGMVGLNFATGFLRPDGQMRPDTEIELMVRQLDAMIEAVGETRVALGSDFDGANIPAGIGSAAGLPVLFEALEKHGYDQPLMDRIGHGNWLALLERTID